MKKILIYTDNQSNKFWRIEVIEKKYTITFGKIGSNGQTKTKEFFSAEKCEQEANKLVAEKLKKGYIETSQETLDTNTESQNISKEEKTSGKRYLTFTKAWEDKEVINDDDYSIMAFNVDLDDPLSILATLKSFTNKIKDEEFREEWEGAGNFPPFGKVENKLFHQLISDGNDGYDKITNKHLKYDLYADRYFNPNIFYRKAAQSIETQKELEKLCKQIIRINLEQSGIPTWETEEHLLGIAPAFALAMEDTKYIPLAKDMICSMYNGDHSTPVGPVLNLFNKWGANDSTLHFAVSYITIIPGDIGLAESVMINTFSEYLKDDKNLNLFLKYYAKVFENSYSEPDWLFSQIFPKEVVGSYLETFINLVEEGKVPTIGLIKKELLKDSIPPTSFDPENEKDCKDYIKAIRKGKVALVKQYIENGFGTKKKVYRSKHSYIRPFEAVIASRNPEMLQLFTSLMDDYIQDGIAPNEYSYFVTASHENGEANIRFLIDGGYDFKKDPTIISNYLAFRLSDDLMKDILDRIDFSIVDEEIALQALQKGSSSNRNPHLFVNLVDKICEKTDFGNNPDFINEVLLYALIWQGKSIDVIKHIVEEKGANPNAEIKDGANVLESAFSYQIDVSDEVAEYMYKHTNRHNLDVFNVIRALSHNLELLKLLLKDVSFKDKLWHKMTPIDYAHNYSDEVKEYIKKRMAE